VTRQSIEHQLERMQRKVPDRWWTPYALLGAAAVLGLVLSRVPVARIVGYGARGVQTGITVATTLAAIDRFLATRRAQRAA
jgi:hypothetical protein